MVAEEENNIRARSFRYEDYDTRRVFLRSYPLHWGGDEESINYEDMQFEKEENENKKHMKKLFVSVFNWGEDKVFVLRRFKHKVSIYMIACFPVHLIKAPRAMISAR